MKLSTLIGGLALMLLVGALPAIAHDIGPAGDAVGTARAGAMAQMGSHMSMGAHMVMTEPRPASEADTERARRILETLRAAIVRYRDYRVALASDYHVFLPTIPQEVYHFTNYDDSAAEYSGHFDPAHPGSLLYLRQGGDYRLVGAMYSAPPGSTPAELDALIPLSVGTWHAHTNICLPAGISLRDLLRGNFGAGDSFMPGMIPAGQNPRAAELNREFGVFADGRFGFTGRIADASACESAGGHFIKQAFGWMIHVYPFAGDDLKVAYGTSVPKSDGAR